MGRLGELLSPARVFQMKSDLISKIAAESSDNRFHREQLSRKVAVLQAGIETCKRHVSRSVPSKPQSRFDKVNSIFMDLRMNNKIDLQRRAWHAEVHFAPENISDGDHRDSVSQTTKAGIQDTVRVSHIGLELSLN